MLEKCLWGPYTVILYIPPNLLRWEIGTPITKKYEDKWHTPGTPPLHEELLHQKYKISTFLTTTIPFVRSWAIYVQSGCCAIPALSLEWAKIILDGSKNSECTSLQNAEQPDCIELQYQSNPMQANTLHLRSAFWMSLHWHPRQIASVVCF